MDPGARPINTLRVLIVHLIPVALGATEETLLRSRPHLQCLPVVKCLECHEGKFKFRIR